MDPFLGHGNTANAAARRGLKFVGSEMVEHYLGEAIRRIKDEIGT
jgi:DNA modification methylase